MSNLFINTRKNWLLKMFNYKICTHNTLTNNTDNLSFAAIQEQKTRTPMNETMTTKNPFADYFIKMPKTPTFFTGKIPYFLKV